MSWPRFVGGCLGRMGFLFLWVRGFLEGGVGLSLAGGLRSADSDNRCVLMGCVTSCRCCVVCPGC